LAREACYVLGLDLGGTKVAVGIGTADGVLVDEERFAVADLADAAGVIDEAVRRARGLAAGRTVQAVGVSSMGITHDAGVLLAPNVAGWDRLRLPQVFREAFPGVPVAIANDVKAACLAEMRWGALQGEIPVAYLNLGTGVAMAFGTGGTIWDGAHGAAGEIAYLWNAGEAGFADGHAPLEEMLGGGALDREALARFGQDGLPAAFAAWDREPAVAEWLTARLEQLAWAVGNVLVALDVDRVAIGGGMVAQYDRIAPILDRTWRRYLPFPPALTKARYGDRAGLMGAVAVGAGAVAP
jgi:glucokinase